MNATAEQRIHELGREWTEAETRGDVAALDALAAEDFTLVGPLGFVLDRERWIGRYRGGAMVTHSMTWKEVNVRPYGDAAVAVGVVEQRAAYEGRPSDGRFRVTQILLRRDDRWVLAGLHYSPIAPSPGRPVD